MSTTLRAISENDGCAMVPLNLLRSGQCGKICDVVGGGCLVQRLREMGVRAGASVQMIRAGSPCIFRLDGQKLCVRSDEMTGVLVMTGAAG